MQYAIVTISCESQEELARQLADQIQFSDDVDDAGRGMLIVDCCRQVGNFELATFFADKLDALNVCQSGKLQCDLRDQKEKIAAGDKSGPPKPEAVSLPPLASRLKTFWSALVNHAVDGFEKCEQPEIDRRLSICQVCPNLQNDHCSVCGCACGGSQTFFNKLAWKSEKCPVGKF